MIALTFTLELTEPLLVKEAATGDPNSAIGLRYIPGGTIRGALIGRYLREKTPGGTIGAADTQFRHLFLGGDVCYLNAYPLAGDDRRSLPVPLSWFHPKDKDIPLHDFAVGDDQPGWRRVNASYCHFDPGNHGTVRFYEPAMQVDIHISRGKRQPSAQKEDKSVFRYEALAAGGKFAAAVAFTGPDGLENRQLRTMVKALLPGGDYINLGASHLAGYGRVRIADIRERDDWAEFEPEDSPVVHNEGKIVVTLLSDALVRDDQTGAWAADLRPVLGCKHEKAFQRVHLVGGFNRKWNLPLCQAQAIQAGSVFVYPYSLALARRLAEAVKGGIGERRAEGFGRLAVNWQTALELEGYRVEDERDTLPVSIPADDALAVGLARRMATRMLRNTLDAALVETVARMDHRDLSALRKSQMGRWRRALREAWYQRDPAGLRACLAGVKDTGRSQLRRAGIDGKKMEQWLKDLVDNPRVVWQVINNKARLDTHRQLPCVGGIKADITNDLALEYGARLIDALLAEAAREEET